MNNTIGSGIEWVFASDKIQPEIFTPSAVNTRLTSRLAQFFVDNPDSKVTLMHLSRALDYDYTVPVIITELERLVTTGFIEHHDDEDYRRYSLNKEMRRKLGDLTQTSRSQEP